MIWLPPAIINARNLLTRYSCLWKERKYVSEYIRSMNECIIRPQGSAI